MEKTMKNVKHWWRVPLLLFACLIGGSSPTFAGVWHFNNSSEHVVRSHPSLSSPYMSFIVMYFDKTGNDNGFFVDQKPTSLVSKIPSDAADGPALFINGEYVCSPRQLRLRGLGINPDVECSNNSWWMDTYSRTLSDGITYTVMFHNPYHQGSTKRDLCDVLIFPNKLVQGKEYKVVIAGMWRSEKSFKTPAEESSTWSFNAIPSLGIATPTASMVNYSQMQISGKLVKDYPTVVGSYMNAKGNNWSDNLTSSVPFDGSTTEYTNKIIDFTDQERSDYYNNANKYVEYILSINDYSPTSDFHELGVTQDGYTYPKQNINYYQWFKTTVPGFIRATGLSSQNIISDAWEKEVTLSWDTEGSNTNGRWNIYCYKTADGTNAARTNLTPNGLDASTRSHTVTAPGYDENYTYEVSFIPTNGNKRSELTSSVDYKLARSWNFTSFTTDVNEDNHIVLKWSHSKLVDAGGGKSYTLYIQRSTDYDPDKPDKATWSNLTTQSIASNSITDGTYIDKSEGLQANTTYYYRVVVNVMEKDMTTDPLPASLGSSKILTFNATRGTYSSLVKLKWTVKQAGTTLTNFIVQRRPLGSNDEKAWAEIYTTSGTASAYSYDDVTAQPGSFNEYKVLVWSETNGKVYYGSAMKTDGFSLSTGIISGNITYGTGTAVQGVKVTLKQQSADGSLTQGMRSLRLRENGSGLTCETDTSTIRKLFNDNFSVQFYVNPSIAEMNADNTHYFLLDVFDLFSICLKKDANNGFKLGGWISNYEYTNFIIPADKWSHVTLVHNKAAKTTTFYITTPDTIQQAVLFNDRQLNWSASAKLADAIGIGQFVGDKDIQCFRGYLDEFRFFTKALTTDEIKMNFNHPLAGNEDGLAIYYPLDEGLKTQSLAYDFSKTNGISNGRHAKMAVAAEGSQYIPTEDLLSLMGYTNKNGAYEVHGVPFSGEGTSYSIVPSLGIHEFSPSSRSRYVSMSSLQHNGVDFEDISSFPVSGKVFYKGTDCPVEGVSFSVDGMPCSKDGKRVTTDDQGEFTISVPIGNHFITVEKSGHVFANDGRYPADPDSLGIRRNFDRKLTGLEFIDSTLVNFTGRVVGGSIEGDKPIGFGLSENNIGVTELVLTPQNGTPRMNVKKRKDQTPVIYDPNDKTVDIESATTDIKSISWRGAGNDCDKLFIRTDSATGEFSAMVPPLQYMVGAIKVVKTKERIYDPTTVDLSQPLLNYKDSTENGNGGYKYYEYNTLMRKTYHSDPTFTMVQTGNTDGAFGESSYEVSDVNGTFNVTNIYNKDNAGNVNYTYGGAIFVMDNPYTFNFEGFEQYNNYDVDSLNPVISKVPLAETVVTIDNELSSSQSVYIEGNPDGAEPGSIANLQSNQLQLDSLGRATYKWKAGYPNIAKPYTRTISVSYEIDNKTYQWNNGTPITGIVLGALPTGNNFVTKGPDMIDMVLRDPPGTKSKAEWTSGTVKSYNHSRGGTWSSDTHIKTKSKLGATSKNGVGLGVMTIQELDAKVDLTVGVDVKVEGEDANSWGRTVTATRTISTSDEMEYVGAQGDLYIGSSTNIIYGLARDVDFVRIGTSEEVELKLEDVLTTTLGFDTEFAYTQNFIENSLIPRLEKMRDDLLTTVTDTIGFVNTEKDPVYLTLLDSSDEKFASSNHDKDVWGNEAKDAPSPGGPSYRMYIPKGSTKNYQDMVEWCNNSILNWQNRIRDNEKDKVEAYKKAEQDRKDSIEVLNVSFDSGTSVTSTIETENTKGTKYDCNVTSVAVINLEMGCGINETGVYWDVGTETGGGEHFEDETETKNIASFSYTLQEEGDDDAITVDIYQYGKYGPIFRTRGGQTSAPYEGEVRTTYYVDSISGEHPIIMEATMQIEVPQITVDVAEVTDVPTGGTANYTLRLSNASEIDEDVYYRLLVADETNPDGAIISIDGKVITDNRIIKVPAGQTVTKLLQLKQGDMSILDYLGNNEKEHELYHKGIALVLASQSQYDPTSTWDVIADTVYIKAHFVPSSSPVELALSNTLMNTQTGTDLDLTFSNFDRNYRGLKAFRLQYKKQGSTDWVQIHEFVLNKADKTANNDTLPASGGSVNFKLPMKSFTDGNYLFRVVSASTYGTGEVYRYSNEMALVKDMQKPRPLGQPEPTDGILDIGDDLSVTFNEPFLKGELTKEKNFIVTGVLNGATVDHNTALSVNSGSTDVATATTEASINLAGKDFSIDTWVNITGAGTLLSHGAATNKLTVGTNNEGKLVVTIADSTYISKKVVPTNTWAFLSFSYQNIEDGYKIMATMMSDSGETTLFSGDPVIAYNGNGLLSVGRGSQAAMHELLLWDEAHDMSTALMNRSKTKNPSTRHLIGYWKMNEGEGKTIRDFARSRNMTMSNETWYMNNVNKATKLDGTQFISVLTADMEIFNEDDYVVELWMRGDKQTGEAQLLQMGDVALWTNAEGQLNLTGKGAYDENAYQSSIIKVQSSILDNAWHHLALNVLRQGSAALYVDGQRVLTTIPSNIGSIATDKMLIGARRTTFASGEDYTFDRPFTGEIDEVRIWGATMNADKLASNRKLRLTGSEDGLLAYFPFEKNHLDSGNQVEVIGTFDNMAKNSHNAELNSLNSQSSTAQFTNGPAMREKPTETNVSFNFTASDNKIVIELDEEEDAAALEGCTINFTVRDVRDENGNYSVPAIWSAFVSRNELTWADGELSVETPVETSSSVTATIVNKGGKQQMWTLEGMPTWLKASAEYGTTNPRSESQVTFTVSPATPIGKYEETVYLKGNNGIETPLTIKVKVTGDEPLWSVNVGDYEETMDVIANLFLLDQMSEDEDDLVGAFIDGVCRGVAHPIYEQDYDSYFVTMDIYGNSGDKNKQIEFKAYDASTGIIYPVVKHYKYNETTATEMVFQSNNLNGRFATPLKLAATDEVEQNIDLIKGWNWISFGVKPDTFNVETVFSKADGKVVFAQNFNGNSSEFDGSEWIGRPWTMTNLDMYTIQTSDALTLNVTGHRVKSSDELINLNTDWNWVAFNSLSVMSLDEALAGMSPIEDEIIKGQRGVAYYENGKWYGNLKQLTPGKGYKIQSKQARPFAYPTKTATAAGSRRAMPMAEGQMVSVQFTPVDYHNYPGNMVLIAQLLLDGSPVEGVELGVFAGDECREAAVSDERGMIVITIPGNESCELTFRVATDDDQWSMLNAHITYANDAVVGAPKTPFILDLGEATGVMDIYRDAMANSDIYDLQGRKVQLNDKSRKLRKGVYVINGQKKVK